MTSISSTSKLKDSLVVLVVSCDQYCDLWEPFFALFWHFWPDCPFNVYLLSNNIRVARPRVENLLVGNDVSWSDNLSRGLSQINEEYVLLFIDDLFLRDFVETSRILEVLNSALKKQANNVRLNALPKPDKKLDETIGIVSKGTYYRASVVSSIWKKRVLLDLLESGESAWDFEICGSVRSDRYDHFYSTWENYFPVINGVIKGKWQKSVVRELKSFGVTVDLAKRPAMTLGETIRFYFKRQRTNILSLCPIKYRRSIRDFFLRKKYNCKSKIEYTERKV